MKLQKVTLTTSKPEELLAFYTQVLHMPLIESTPRSFAVSVGEATLAFQRAEQKPFYHFACGIAERAFDSYAEAIRQRGIVLRSKDGQEVMQSYTWKGKQLYFADPEGNILELLAFSTEAKTDWLSIQEVGMPVPDVAAFAASLAPIPSEFEAESEVFRFYGDQDGVLVLVKANRPWYPTDRGATIHPIAIELAPEPEPERGQQGLVHTSPPLPYRIVC